MFLLNHILQEGDEVAPFMPTNLHHFIGHYPQEPEDLQIEDNNIVNGGTCHLQFKWTGDPVQTIDFHFICYDPSSEITITVDQSSIGQEGAVNFSYEVSPYILYGIS
jgi:hypothetical protein